MFRKTRALFQKTRALFQKTRALFQKTRALFQKTRALFQKTRALFQKTRTVMFRNLNNLEKRPSMRTGTLMSDHLNLQKDRSMRNPKPHENPTVCIINLCQPLVKICYSAAASLSNIYPELVHCDLLSLLGVYLFSSVKRGPV
jgi:hypothetical protein